MDIKRFLFPIWYDLKDLNYSSEDRMFDETLQLARELKDEPPMTAQEIQDYVNKKRLNK